MDAAFLQKTLSEFADFYEHATALPDWELAKIHEGNTDGYDPLRFTATFQYAPDDDQPSIDQPYKILKQATAYLAEKDGWELNEFSHEEIESDSLTITVEFVWMGEEEPAEDELDVDAITTGTTINQRDRVRDALTIVEELESPNIEGALIEDVIQTLTDEQDMDREQVEHQIENLKQKGELYEPSQGHIRTT